MTAFIAFLMVVLVGMIGMEIFLLNRQNVLLQLLAEMKEKVEKPLPLMDVSPSPSPSTSRSSSCLPDDHLAEVLVRESPSSPWQQTSWVRVDSPAYLDAFRTPNMALRHSSSPYIEEGVQ